MRRTGLLAPCAAALAVLGAVACTTYDPVTPATGTITSPAAAVAVPAAPVAVVPAPGTAVVQGPTIVQAPAVVPAPVVAAFRPGRGVVDAVTALTYPAYPSASSGASTPARQVWRLTVRMDDGTTQTLDQDNRAFQPGDRVEITRDGHVVR